MKGMTVQHLLLAGRLENKRSKGKKKWRLREREKERWQAGGHSPYGGRVWGPWSVYPAHSHD